MKSNDWAKISVLAILLLSAQAGLSFCKTQAACAALTSASCFLLYVATRWASPAAAVALGAGVPLAGQLLGMFAGFGYALIASIANGLMISMSVLFQKRSMLLGVLASSLVRFVYCWAMVFRIMPLLPGYTADKAMQTLFSIAQLAGPAVGGLAALPLLFYMQFKHEQPGQP